MKKKLYIVIGIFFIALLGLEVLKLGTGAIGNALLNYSNPKTTSFIRRYELQKKKKAKLDWIDLSKISKNLIRAVLVAEDDAFFDHEGIDIKEFKESWKVNWRKKKIVRGGSTLTMQLIKNLYFNEKKSPLRKLNEIILAFDLENKLTKKRILEVYLNIVEWGPGIYGAESASQFYFNKSARQLTPAEAAYLAALLPNPDYLTKKGKSRARRRQNIILSRMHRRTLSKGI